MGSRKQNNPLLVFTHVCDCACACVQMPVVVICSSDIIISSDSLLFPFLLPPKDDGSLSLDEFCKFFSDDVMTREELEAMFSKIDKDKSEDISPEE